MILKMQKKILKWYWKYGRKVSLNVKWYGKYGRKLVEKWNDMEDMEEKWKDRENTEENWEQIWKIVK